MAIRIHNLGKRLRQRGDNIPREVNKVVKRAVLAVDQAVVLATPVDTGAARSNWLASIGSERTDTIDPYAPTKKGGVGETANAEGALRQAEEVLAERKPGDVVYLTNNLDYIEELNDGKSQQAPANFIQIGISAGLDAIATSKINTGD